jgi:ATP-dependent DNA helicase PIF1
VLNSCQERALEVLGGQGNSFLTGVAGSGKSYLIRHFLKKKNSKTFPILASTGAAAILVGGRTFHSYFGLGIMQGGFEATVNRALENKRLVKRLKKAEGAVIDEVSMLSGTTLRAAETIARLVRENSNPWGGLQIVTVGDFAQLPPVNPYGTEKDWAFLDDTWAQSDFIPAILNTPMRTSDEEFIEVLNSVRDGQVTQKVREFLDERQSMDSGDFDGTVLFPHRETTERYNLTRLEELPGSATTFETAYSGDHRFLENLAKNAPVPRQLVLKIGALVMIRQNDPQGRWFNGSLGHLTGLTQTHLKVRLLEGETAELEKVSFSSLDAEGKEIASATNFPVNLAYASTIHKAQGMTLDQVKVDLGQLWEPGQAYVAMSRAKSGSGLYLTRWSPQSIKSDPVVTRFNKGLWDFR